MTFLVKTEKHFIKYTSLACKLSIGILLISFHEAFANTGVTEFGKISTFLLENIQGYVGKIIMTLSFGMMLLNIISSPNIKVITPCAAIGTAMLCMTYILSPFGAII